MTKILEIKDTLGATESSAPIQPTVETIISAYGKAFKGIQPYPAMKELHQATDTLMEHYVLNLDIKQDIALVYAHFLGLMQVLFESDNITQDDIDEELRKLVKYWKM